MSEPNETCSTCKWWKWARDYTVFEWNGSYSPEVWKTGSYCRRYPEYVTRLADDMCGEWKAVAGVEGFQTAQVAETPAMGDGKQQGMWCEEVPAMMPGDIVTFDPALGLRDGVLDENMQVVPDGETIRKAAE
jgi:hypothetical protein